MRRQQLWSFLRTKLEAFKERGNIDFTSLFRLLSTTQCVVVRKYNISYTIQYIFSSKFYYSVHYFTLWLVEELIRFNILLIVNP